jgi:hypothetical protein
MLMENRDRTRDQGSPDQMPGKSTPGQQQDDDRTDPRRTREEEERDNDRQSPRRNPEPNQPKTA